MNKPTEADIVVQIQEGLRALGFIVLRVGQHRADLAGTTAGTPDLFVGRSAWGNRWIGIEVKALGGRVRPSQKEMLLRGLVGVAHNFDEARALVIDNREEE
jgi:hypothetical protein